MVQKSQTNHRWDGAKTLEMIGETTNLNWWVYRISAINSMKSKFGSFFPQKKWGKPSATNRLKRQHLDTKICGHKMEQQGACQCEPHFANIKTTKLELWRDLSPQPSDFICSPRQGSSTKHRMEARIVARARLLSDPRRSKNGLDMFRHVFDST